MQPLIVRPACLCTSRPEHPFLKRASSFFLFLYFCSLGLKDSPALSVYVMETDEPQGRVEGPSSAWQKYSRALQILLQSLEEPQDVDKVHRGFLSSSAYCKKESAGDQIKKKKITLPIHRQHAIDRLITHQHIFTSLFTLFSSFLLIPLPLTQQQNGKERKKLSDCISLQMTC